MSKHARLLRQAANLMLLIVLLLPASGAAAPALGPGHRIPWRDGNWFLSGINYPYFRAYGGDLATLNFRAQADKVTADIYDAAAIEADMARMQAGGVHVLRWFLFGDGRAAPEFDASGRVTGLDAALIPHMREVLNIAARHNIYIIWSIWDFLAFKPALWLCGPSPAALFDAAEKSVARLPDEQQAQYLLHLRAAVQPVAFDAQGRPNSLTDTRPSDGDCLYNGGGHRNIVTDHAVQDSMFTRALIPLFDTFKDNPNIIGWEIMNEPEEAVQDLARLGRNARADLEPVSLAAMRALFQSFTRTLHQHAPGQLATVGGASLLWLGAPDDQGRELYGNIWQNLGFDYYGAHYYGWMEHRNASPLTLDYDTMAASGDLDRPVVIGEFPAYGGTPPIYLPAIRRQGSEQTALTVRSVCSPFERAHDVPCTRTVTAIVEYRTPGGNLQWADTLSIPPGGSVTVAPPAGLGDNWTGAARITANSVIAAQVVQRGIANAAEQVSYMSQDSGAMRLYVPLALNLDNHHRTRFALQNTAADPATVSINYYNRDGSLAASAGGITLGAFGSLLLDPDSASGDKAAQLSGPGIGFEGTASISSNRALVGVVYELDPLAGSDAYNMVPEGYTDDLYLPALRNGGDAPTGSIFVQNAWNESKTITVNYYSAAGARLPARPEDRVALSGYASTRIDLAARLPAGFSGSAVISGTRFLAAVVRSAGGGNLSLYASYPQTWDRFAFPLADGAIFTAQNIHPTRTITITSLFNTTAGASTAVSTTIPPHGRVEIRPADYVGPGFSGSVAVLWPWPSEAHPAWDSGFPLLAVARASGGAGSYGGLGAVVHANGDLVTPFSPHEILEGVLTNNWAGALAWSYYDTGAGGWDDYVAASRDFSAAHPELISIGSCQPNFSDVHTGDYFYPQLRQLYCAGAISGYGDGTFRPFADATRGQLAKIVTLGHGWALSTPAGPHFSDVAVDNTFYSYVETAYSHGVIAGYGDGTFRPNSAVTRGQIAKIVARAAGWTLTNPAQPTFRDVGPSNPFYREIESAVQHGVISGYDVGAGQKEFRWGANATRGQISKILALSLPPPAPAAAGH